MCKEMLVISVDRVVDKKRIIVKMECQGGGEAQWVADPKKTTKKHSKYIHMYIVHTYVTFCFNDCCLKFEPGLPGGIFSNQKYQCG
jgi:hypothetical protein